MTGLICPWIRLKVTLTALVATLGVPLQALAANGDTGWRSTYDVVMMWVNFAILVALLVKFLRKPLGRFLSSQRDAIKKTFDELEGEKKRIAEDIRTLRETVETRRQNAEDRHRRLLEQARQERQDIIAIARDEAQRRLTKARQNIDARHREAYHKLRNEIIDAAVAKVMTALPDHMTAELEQDLTDRFLSSITKSKP